MNKVFLFIFILSIKLHAQVILVPSAELDLDSYLNHCKIEGYMCTQDYFKQTLKKQKSEVFDQFIENLDLYNEDYRKFLQIKIKSLLENENLNLEQVELLIKVISRFESIDKNLVLSQIKTELKELSFEVQNIFEENAESESYFLFGKFLTKKQYLNLKFKQKYTKTIKITPFTEPGNAKEFENKKLIQGNCENFKISDLFQNHPEIHYTVSFKKDCADSNFHTETTPDSHFKWQEYKKPLIYTAVALVLIGVMSTYQMEMTY